MFLYTDMKKYLIILLVLLLAVVIIVYIKITKKENNMNNEPVIKATESMSKNVTYICEKGVSGINVSMKDGKIVVEYQDYNNRENNKTYLFDQKKNDPSGKYTSEDGKHTFWISGIEANLTKMEIDGKSTKMVCQGTEYFAGME